MPNIIGYNEILTIEGDTWDALALEFYDDEQKSTLIMGANLDYCDTLIFPADVRLKIPIVNEVDTPDTLPPWRRSA